MFHGQTKVTRNVLFAFFHELLSPIEISVVEKLSKKFLYDF